MTQKKCWDLIRTIYHDNINMINPVIELLKILSGEIDNNISNQMLLNLYQATDTLKNARMLVRLQEDKQKKVSIFRLKEAVKPIIERMKDRYPFSKQIKTSNLEITDRIFLKTDIGMLETLFENLILNAYRFSNSYYLNLSDKVITIKNPINEDLGPLFNMPIKTDRFGITGSGLGLKVVKAISEKLKINIDSAIKENVLTVQIDISALIK